MRLKTLWLAAILLTASPAFGAEITAMSGGAPKEALTVLIPQFEKLTGHQVKLTYILISALRQKLMAGEVAPDVVIMPTSASDGLVDAGRLQAGSRASFGTLKLLAIVKDGAPKPDIATPDAFRAALLNARTLVYSTPTATPSGAHMARVVTQLGIADAIKAKVTYRPALEGGVELVATGAAEIGIYPASEVVHVKGVVPIGPLPDALQLNLTYGGAITTSNTNSEPAATLIRFLAAPEHREVWRHAGFE